MFKRLIIEDWMSVIPMVAFILMFAAFVVLSWKAIRMARPLREHMAHLPLEDEDDHSGNGASRPRN